ncbi:MAG: 4Fe-4S dicluster domain-containing protein [Bacteroidales bacterium]|jgi:heterodisulfide reductase subunit C
MNNAQIAGQIQADPRYHEACRSCMNCGVCTAICPAAGYYDYDPRVIMNLVNDGDEESLVEMLSSDLIWFCGQCMSCKPRCPRGNVPGALIQILRSVSINTGLFARSHLGRQQLAIKRAIGHNILETGYCIHPTRVDPKLHPEQGPVWAWMSDYADQVYGRFDSGYDKSGPGLLRKISPKALDELDRIFEVTGCKKLWEKIENKVVKEEG